MMRVLIVKTSSLGDLIHTFPALTDAMRALPNARFDWLVDASFIEAPTWHKGVDRVIDIDLRSWHDKSITYHLEQWKDFTSRLEETDYDRVIDAQGLLKSALLAWKAKGLAVGYNAKSIREPVASLFYRKKYPVPRAWHAIKRIRHLFAQALDYKLDEQPLDYGLCFASTPTNNHVLFLHGTTWSSKLWPDIYWAELAGLIRQAGFYPRFAWHTPQERLRAERIMRMAGAGQLLPSLHLTGMAQRLAQAAGAIGVDSGLAHLAAAVGTPAVTLYGPTNTALTGATGQHQTNLASTFDCAPCMQRTCAYQGESKVKPACFGELSPAKVWQNLHNQMTTSNP